MGRTTFCPMRSLESRRAISGELLFLLLQFIHSVYDRACEESLLHAEQFDFKTQRRIRGDNARYGPGAVSELRWNDQFALAANFHSGNTFVPALDDLSGTQSETERSSSHGAIELVSSFAIHVE